MIKSYDIPAETAISVLKDLAYCTYLDKLQRTAIKYALAYLVDFSGVVEHVF